MKSTRRVLPIARELLAGAIARLALIPQIDLVREAIDACGRDADRLIALEVESL